MNNYIVLIDMRRNTGSAKVMALSDSVGEIHIFCNLEDIHKVHDLHVLAVLPWTVLDIDDMEVVETIF